MKITFNNLSWPDTGRKCPENAELQIFYVHENWADLCWLDKARDVWVYLSTLPREKVLIT